MAMDPATAQAIGAGAGAAFNMANQWYTNYKNRQWQEKMYGRQRSDALEDWQRQNAYNEQMLGNQRAYDENWWHKQNAYNRELWDMENKYNSPAAQMARYKAAGLNPNLIYGQSNTGGSISTAQFESERPRAAQKASPTYGNYNAVAPQFDLQNGILSAMELRQRQAQTDAIKASTEVSKQDALLRATQIANTAADTANKNFALGLNSDLRQTSVDAAKANLRTLIQTLDISAQRNTREGLMNMSQLATMSDQRDNLKLDTKLKQLDIDMRKLGVEKTDPIYWRVLSRLFNSKEIQGTMNADYYKD